MSISRAEWLGIGLMATGAFLVRIVVAFFLGSEPLVHDSTVYLTMAAAIVEGEPVSGFPNGYPLLLAIPRLLLSQRETVSAVLFFNAVASTLTVGLTWLCARSWAPEFRGWPLVAAGFIALFPHQLRYVQLVMSEVPAGLFLLAGIWALVEGTRKKRWDSPETLWLRIGSGLSLHMAASIRPSFLLVFPLLMLLLLLRRMPWRGTATFAAGFALGAVLLFGIEKAGIVRPPAAQANNLLIAISSNSSDTQFRMFPEDERKKALKTYLEFAAKNPGVFLRQRAESLWELWGPVSLPGYRKEQEGALIKMVILTRPILLLVALSGWWIRRRDLAAWVFGIPVVALTVIHTATFSNHRFIAPIEPLLALLAAGVLDRFRHGRTADKLKEATVQAQTSA